MARPYAIIYPRRTVIRFILRMIGRVLVRLLTRPEIRGLENLPKQGPVILVGNHVAMIEVILMAVYVPWQVEFIGTGDIPVDPRFAWMANLYGFLPVSRGSTDRQEMQMPLDVLKQGGVVGIFPEGGIWSTTMKRARTGVAWLSFHGNAAVLPMGFGGMRGAIQAVMQLKRPRVVMNVGTLMPPVSGKIEGLSRKAALEQAANDIMAAVEALIPAEEKQGWSPIVDEQFDFELISHNGTTETQIPLEHAAGLGQFFHIPVILDVMMRNFKLPLDALQQLDSDPQAIADAADLALAFLDDHPQFLSYRFGYQDADAIRSSVVELRDQARAAAARGDTLTLRPIHRYRQGENGTEIIETTPGTMHDM
ncbi:MAG: hypothetical protein CL610_13735 [Anaerolineaceae bacterium]|nr:hypothetical protein [Anaerolineaceae bacterium]